MGKQPPRVLVAKVGLDGHDRGAKVVVRALEEADMDVTYTGIRNTAEEVVALAVEKEVDVLGVSTLSGAHATIFRRIFDELERRKVHDVIVIGGGIVAADDLEILRSQGLAAFWGPGTHTGDIVEFIRANVC